MSRYTLTLNEFLISELQKMGRNEIVNGNHITAFDENYAFQKKIIRYDNDVKHITDNYIFYDFLLETNESDETYKKMFINKFLNREINRQTIESFAGLLYSFNLEHQNYINIIFSNDIEMYLNNAQTRDYIKDTTDDNINVLDKDSNTLMNSTDTNINDNRSLDSTLPNNEVNLNVDNTILDYGDKNTISRNKLHDEKEQTTDNVENALTTNNNVGNEISKEITKTFNIQSLNDLYFLRTKLLKDMDKLLFLQIW